MKKLRTTKKFNEISVNYNGVYYFPMDMTTSNKREGKEYSLQGVFYSGKWRQDTFYIDRELKEKIINSLPKKYKDRFYRIKPINF